MIGHYAAADDESAAMLLDFASRQLAAEGCTIALGPMDQNTWRDYRFVVWDRGQPPFFREPASATAWPQQFSRDGFREIAGYFSAVVDDLTIHSPRLDGARGRIRERAVRIRPLCRERFESDLGQIHSVASVAFRDNLFFEPMSEADFVDQYRPLESLIPAELILLAEHSGRVVGFCFAMPDLLQAERGEPLDTVIIKTFGVLPRQTYAGLGQVLLEETQQRAAALGFRRGIHALVRDVDHMKKISGRYAVPFRRYAMFGKELSP